MLIKILQDSRALTKRSESLSKKGYQVKNNFLNIKICQQLQLTQYVYTYLYIYIVHTYICIYKVIPRDIYIRIYIDEW